MSEKIVAAIKALYDQHNEKVEKLKTVVGLGVTQEDLEKYEKQSLESCHAASAKLLKNDLVETFGADGVVEDGNTSSTDATLDRVKRMAGIPLGGASSGHSSSSAPRSTKKSATRKSDNVELNYKCQECGKAFVNAGNLKNHQYAHDREVRVRQSVANVSAQEFMEMIAVSNKDVAAAIKQIIGTDKETTVGEAFPHSETSATKRRRMAAGLLDRDDDDDDDDEDKEVTLHPNSEYKKKKSVGGAPTRKAYTLQEKLLVLEKHDELVRNNELKDLQFNVGRFFGISQSLVSKWLKNRQVIEENAKDSSGKRLKYHYKSSGSHANYGHGGGGSSSSSNGGAGASSRVAAAPGSPHSVSSSDSIEELIANSAATGGGGAGGLAAGSSSAGILYNTTATSAATTAAPNVVMVPKKKGRGSAAL